MTGLIGTVVDAAIGWLVQSILGSFFTGQMEAWTREIGLAEDVENLKLEMRNVEMVLAAAGRRRIEIENKPLARSLDDLKELIYDSEDVMDELDYYRLNQQIEEGIQGNLDVPTGMNNLVNLRHLIAHEEVHQAIDCVGNMTSLQELKFKVENFGSFEIGQLHSMNELVLLGISQLENVKTKEEARGANLIDKEYLETLSLSWDDSSTGLQPEIAKDVLEGLQPHQSLKTLEITGYGGSTSPTWLSSTFSVTSLQILHLEQCREWQVLPSLEMLPFLRKLTLTRMLDVAEISVPSLEELILIDMPKLQKCIGSYGMELTSHLKIQSSLQMHFSSCGEITRVSVLKDYETGASKRRAYMVFSDNSFLSKAMELSGSDVGGFSLFVNEAKPRPDNRDGPGSR
ncbi:hypothetical protein ACQ4PT_049797 [Festuca glaucescens]